MPGTIAVLAGRGEALSEKATIGLGGAQWPDDQSLGGRIVLDILRTLGGTVHVSNGKIGTRVTISVPKRAQTATPVP